MGGVATLTPIQAITARLQAAAPANFAYTAAAYTGNEIEGVESFNIANDMNVPNNDATDTNASVLNTGFQTQGASIPRNMANHFFGRLSFNLRKLTDQFYAFMALEQAQWAQNAFQYDANQPYPQGAVCFQVSVVSGVQYIIHYIRTSSTPLTITGIAPPNATHWTVMQVGSAINPQAPVNALGYQRSFSLIDLSNTGTYLTTTWYPVVTSPLGLAAVVTPADMNTVLTEIEAYVAGTVTGQANSCRASLSATVRTSGWNVAGITDPAAYPTGAFIKNNEFIDQTNGNDLGVANSPIGFTMLPKGQQVVFWLRGGSKYGVWNSFGASFSVKTASYNNGSDPAISPQTSRQFLYNPLKVWGRMGVPTPTQNEDVANKLYVDSAIAAGLPIGSVIMFDANNPGPIVNAGTFNIGESYQIQTVGTTDFTLIGAAANTVGVIFTATGVGSGSGAAYRRLYATGGWSDNVTMPGWYACNPANSVKGCPDMTNRFVMGKDTTGAGATGGTNSYSIAAGNLPPHTHGINHTHGTFTTSNVSNDHTHSIGQQLSAWSAGGSGPNLWRTDSGSVPSTGGMSANHTHTVTVSAFSGSSDNGGFANTAVDNRPAFYSLVFIKRVA
jgi:hypothetical protein